MQIMKIICNERYYGTPWFENRGRLKISQCFKYILLRMLFADVSAFLRTRSWFRLPGGSAEDFGGDECLYSFQVDRLILPSSLDVIRKFSDRSNRISMLFKSTDTYTWNACKLYIFSAKLSCKINYSVLYDENYDPRWRLFNDLSWFETWNLEIENFGFFPRF